MNSPRTPLTVLVAGGTGLIGTVLIRELLDRGDHVIALTREDSTPIAAHPGLSLSRWDPETGVLNQAVVDRADAVVNLSGANVGAKRWNNSYKKTILSSRVNTTALLARAIHQSDSPPRVLLQGSASGYYGKTSEVCDENSPAGSTFLAGVTTRWEQAAQPALAAGTRVAYLRTATVMTPHSGALKQVLTPIRYYAGGSLGPGTQIWSWISLADHVRAMLFVLDTPTAWGPINLVAPENASNARITSSLAQTLGKPNWFRVPTWALRLGLGEFAGEILMDQKIQPRILTELGFTFDHPTVADLMQYVQEQLTTSRS